MSDAPDTTELKRDFRSTVFLPKTDFPMKAGLPQKEPVIAARWKEGDLYGQVRKARAGREKFIFQSRPGVYVLGYLLAPAASKAPHRAMICVPGHGRGVDDIVGIDANVPWRIWFSTVDASGPHWQ